MNEQIRNLLTWNVSARDPIVLVALVSMLAFLTFVLVVRPHLYLPLTFATAPLPKLFTLTQYESWGNNQTASGFSVVDLVLAAGISALLFRGWREARSPEALAFSRAMFLWSGSVALSVGVGLLLSSDYVFGNSLYALRYILTLLCYAVGARYSLAWRDDRSLGRLLRFLTQTGNVVLLLGVAYYFTFGSSDGGAVGNPMLPGDATVFRSYLFFFDYGIDMGYFAVTVAILNMLGLSTQTSFASRAAHGIGLGLTVIAILLLGGRVNLLVLAGAMLYFFLETSNDSHRSVRVGAVFQLACLLTLIGVGTIFMLVVGPSQMVGKFENTTRNEYGSDATGVMAEANVPESFAVFVSTLPIGDNVVRLGLTVASTWYFFQHPAGVGFWGELPVVGWYAHHEIIKIAVEQGVPGFVLFWLLMSRLRRLLWNRGDLPGSAGQLGVLLRSMSVGLFLALLFNNTVLLDMKFAAVYWTLVGVWSMVPRARVVQHLPLELRQREKLHA